MESGYLDETTTHGTALSKNPTSIFGEVKSVRQMITDSAIPKLELHFTEWSSSYSQADPFHDSYVKINRKRLGFHLLGVYRIERFKKCFSTYCSTITRRDFALKRTLEREIFLTAKSLRICAA